MIPRSLRSLLLAGVISTALAGPAAFGAHTPPPWVALPFWLGSYQTRGGPMENLEIDFDPTHGSAVTGQLFAHFPNFASAEFYTFSGTARGNHASLTAHEMGGGDTLAVSGTFTRIPGTAQGVRWKGRLRGQIRGTNLQGTFSLDGAP